MGVVDEIAVPCYKCGSKVSFHSKSGIGIGSNVYRLDNCPPDVACDLINESQKCECGTTLTIRGQVMLTVSYD